MCGPVLKVKTEQVERRNKEGGNEKGGGETRRVGGKGSESEQTINDVTAKVQPKNPIYLLLFSLPPRMLQNYGKMTKDLKIKGRFQDFCNQNQCVAKVIWIQ